MDTNKLNSMAWHLRKAAMQKKSVVVCAWCDVDKTETRKFKALGVIVSHGVCDKHLAEWKDRLGHALQRPLEWFNSANRP